MSAIACDDHPEHRIYGTTHTLFRWIPSHVDLSPIRDQAISPIHSKYTPVRHVMVGINS